MKNMRLLMLLLTAASLFAADRTGPYLSAGIGVSNYDDGGRPVEMENHNVIQYRFGAGAFINQYFSVAFDYAHFDSFEGKRADDTVINQSFSILTADVTGHYTFANDWLDLFARFGAGEIFWEQTGGQTKSSSAATLVYGAGIGVRPVTWLTVNIGYSFYQFGLEDAGGSYDMSLGSAYVECEVQF